MKLICPNCHYQRPVDAAADARLSSSCARCGTPLEQLLWPGLQSPLLQTSTTADPAAAPVAVVDQGIMENQNAYAPSAESFGEDVLEIPRPLRSTQHAGEQLLVLEDVIPVPAAHELSPWEEDTDPQMLDGIASEPDTLLSDDDDDEITLMSPSSSESGIGRNRLAGTDVFVAAKPPAPDYEGYRAWVRIAPLLLLLGALAFFSLYYLGNRMGEGGQETAQNAANNPATQPETQAVAPTTTSSQSVESAQPPATAQPSESSVVGASAETQKPDQKSKVEAAKTEAPPAVIAAPPAAAPVAAAPVVTAAAPSTASSPVIAQAVGNFTVQVGSYNDAAQAEERAGRLRSSGIEARVVRAEIPRRGIWYRVQAGRFASQEDASRYAVEIKGKGATDAFIITAAQ